MQLHVYKPVCEVSEKRTSPIPAAAQRQYPGVQLSPCLAAQDTNTMLTQPLPSRTNPSLCFLQAQQFATARLEDAEEIDLSLLGSVGKKY